MYLLLKVNEFELLFYEILSEEVSDEFLEEILGGRFELPHKHEVLLEDAIVVHLGVTLDCIGDESPLLEVVVHHGGVLLEGVDALVTSEGLHLAAVVVEEFIDESDPHVVLRTYQQLVEVVERELRNEPMGLVHLEGMQVGEYLLIVLLAEQHHLSHESNDIILLLREEVRIVTMQQLHLMLQNQHLHRPPEIVTQRNRKGIGSVLLLQHRLLIRNV